MECQRIEPYLSAWLDGQLPEATAQAVREHLAQCPGCWEELQVLEQLRTRLMTLKLKTNAAEPPPEGLLAGVRALPAWLVRLGVIRRWLALGGGVTVTWGAALLLLSWSDPMTATLTARGTSEPHSLSPGRMLVAHPEETLSLTLPHDAGTIQLQGPGVLIIRQAALGHLTHDQRLAMELPSGRAAIRFNPSAPAHGVRLTTPHAQIRLTGTWVLVATDPAQTQVDVLEGQALVRQLATGRQLSMEAGERLQIEEATVQLLAIPVEEWLARKGITASPDHAVPMTPSVSGQPLLWHEAEDSLTRRSTE